MALFYRTRVLLGRLNTPALASYSTVSFGGGSSVQVDGGAVLGVTVLDSTDFIFA